MLPNWMLDRTYTPKIEEITAFFKGKSAKQWAELLAFIDANFNGVRKEFAYSACTLKPGWNLKCKKGGKALCTLYPGEDHFTVLIVLSAQACAIFDLLREEFCASVQQIYDQFPLMNGTKWLMIDVFEDEELRDSMKLMLMKAKQ